MLVELSVVEQRYQAVLAVIAEGVPEVEVAARFRVSVADIWGSTSLDQPPSGGHLALTVVVAAVLLSR